MSRHNTTPHRRRLRYGLTCAVGDNSTCSRVCSVCVPTCQRYQELLPSGVLLQWYATLADTFRHTSDYCTAARCSPQRTVAGDGRVSPLPGVVCADQCHSKPTTHHIESKDELQGIEGIQDQHQELVDNMIKSHIQRNNNRSIAPLAQVPCSPLAHLTCRLCRCCAALCCLRHYRIAGAVREVGRDGGKEKAELE